MCYISSTRPAVSLAGSVGSPATDAAMPPDAPYIQAMLTALLLQPGEDLGSMADVDELDLASPASAIDHGEAHWDTLVDRDVESVESSLRAEDSPVAAPLAGAIATDADIASIAAPLPSPILDMACPSDVSSASSATYTASASPEYPKSPASPDYSADSHDIDIMMHQRELDALKKRGVDPATLKRYRNTLAARRSRARKVAQLQQFESRCMVLEGQKHELRGRVLELEAERADMLAKIHALEQRVAVLSVPAPHMPSPSPSA